MGRFMSAEMRGKGLSFPAGVAATILVVSISASAVLAILDGREGHDRMGDVASYGAVTPSESLSTRRNDSTPRLCGAWLASRKRLEGLKPPKGLWNSTGPVADILLSSWEMSVSFALSPLEAAVDYSGSDPSTQPAREYLEARRNEFEKLDRNTYTPVDEERSNRAYRALNVACGLD